MRGKIRNERAELVLAMEKIARCINNEDIFMGWLMAGVADGDITDKTTMESEDLDYYVEDDNFAELMGLFLRKMSQARKDGGLYCGGIVSKED